MDGGHHSSGLAGLLVFVLVMACPVSHPWPCMPASDPPLPLTCRVLGGLWPLARGRIYKPGGGADDAEGGLSHACFYVPQRPYVTQGTLREQLVYPLAVSQELVAEPELRRLLAAVDLEYLLDRWAAWGHMCAGWGV